MVISLTPLCRTTLVLNLVFLDKYIEFFSKVLCFERKLDTNDLIEAEYLKIIHLRNKLRFFASNYLTHFPN